MMPDAAICDITTYRILNKQLENLNNKHELIYNGKNSMLNILSKQGLMRVIYTRSMC